MKKTYRQPYIDVTAIDMELLLTTGSEKNKYDIGSDSSKWPSKGDVHDDTGNGPGVSGAKEHHFDEVWGDYGALCLVLAGQSRESGVVPARGRDAVHFAGVSNI